MAIFTARIEQAIAMALQAHAGQVRKGDGQLPYAVHPVTVALILSRFTSEEEVIVAGLLHDTLEDTGLTEAELAATFGDRVRDLVREVTERKLPGLSWDTRKARYLRQLLAAPRGALLVAGADKIANLISMLAAHSVHGDGLWERFNAPPRDKLGFYREVWATIQAAWPTCPLLQEMRNRLEETERKLLSPEEREHLPRLETSLRHEGPPRSAQGRWPDEGAAGPSGPRARPAPPGPRPGRRPGDQARPRPDRP